jgi:hypothetical protein
VLEDITPANVNQQTYSDVVVRQNNSFSTGSTSPSILDSQKQYITQTSETITLWNINGWSINNQDLQKIIIQQLNFDIY